ncbi:hypothetical protein [Vibrio cholerae]|uniref:hypothetical protein n=1 Tax=Vibrio cholerae TaxID=666 RepID=UPI0018F0FE21|nr:hypothetical protein [Vibrio cholerae]EKO5177110.1 hypothetical protein [Vibrio cholerae]MBJ6968275.1 hypothetical protein [Vibrio cholerae]MDV2344157.1 hypothetical protein [Vibrio cholerae]GHZ77828.1 hypothetical protein VCSRO81_3307 [Vibrio cholerae]GIA21362.1 hypothetical protein VCSRO84_3402 [Vibrio cholerae]
MLNVKQKAAKTSKVKKQKLALREQIFGEIKADLLWDRTKQTGFTTIPRTFPLVAQIMDELAEKGKPVSSAYFALWCRVFDESLVEIKNPGQLATESGFSGQRAISTWNGRMAKLVELGFIQAEEGPLGSYEYVLIYNPYLIIKKLYDEKRVSKQKYISLFTRAQEIGAGDLN